MNISHAMIPFVAAASVWMTALPVQAVDVGQQFADLGECKLENGKSIKDCRIGYTTLGKLNPDKSNAVLVSIFPFAPSQYMSQYQPVTSLLDPMKYFYVFVDPIGNGVSVSPSNSKSQAGAAFPEFSIRDSVDINRRLLTEKLGIKHLSGVIGTPDMGSLQAYQWLLGQPEFTDKVLMMQGTPKLTPSDKLYWQALLNSVEDNIDTGKGGWKEPPVNTATLWTLVEHNPRLINNVIARESNNADELLKEYIANFTSLNPYNVRSQFKAVLTQDALKGINSMTDAAKIAKVKALFVISDSNEAFTPEPAMLLAKEMEVKPFVLSDGYGAGGIDLVEAKGLSTSIKDFLNK